jgi:hypothetical protein
MNVHLIGEIAVVTFGATVRVYDDSDRRWPSLVALAEEQSAPFELPPCCADAAGCVIR